MREKIVQILNNYGINFEDKYFFSNGYKILKINNPSKSGFRMYSFWIRSDGRKRQLSMEEVNSYIINTDPYKKKIDVEIHFNSFIPNSGMDRLISIRGVNKSIRPIVVTGYGFQIIEHNNEKFNMWIKPPNLHPDNRFNTTLPIKLQDGDSCSAFYPITDFKKDIDENKILLLVKIKAVIHTNDGMFFSNERELTNEILKK